MSNPPKIGEFCWTELATPNLQAAKDFYGKVFGWTFIDENVGDMVYTMIQHENNTFGGIWSIPEAQQKEIPPHWMAYILVENIETALTQAGQHGATVVRAAENAGEWGRFAVITDPTGAHVALWQNLKK